MIFFGVEIRRAVLSYFLSNILENMSFIEKLNLLPRYLRQYFFPVNYVSEYFAF